MQEHKEAYLNSRERMNPELEEKLKSNTTELAKNPAFPKTDKDGNPINFLELIAYKRFNDTVAKVKQYTNVDGVSSNIGLAKLQPLMMQSVRNVIAFEKPHKEMLEKLAVDLIIEEMEIPQDAFQFDSKIVPLGGVSNEGILQDTKEPSKSEVNAQFGEEYPIEEMTPSEYFELLKHKRRFINLLIQGSSKKGHYMFELIRKKLNGINPTLTDNYGILMSVNDLTYWVMSDSTIDSMASNSQNMSGREEIDNETTPATIKTESICFPVSVHELIKGVMEVFGTQGLPDDKVSAQMLIDSVDSIKNETMDLRFGVVIWEKFISAFPMETFEEGSKNLQHHLFSKFCALEINEFFKISRYILSNDERGANYLENMLREIKIDLSQNDMSDLFGDYDDDNQDDDEYAEGGEITDADLNYYIYPTKVVKIAYLGKIQMGYFFSLKDAMKEIEYLTMAYPKNEIEKYAIITPNKTFHLGEKQFPIRYAGGGRVNNGYLYFPIGDIDYQLEQGKIKVGDIVNYVFHTGYHTKYDPKDSRVELDIKYKVVDIQQANSTEQKLFNEAPRRNFIIEQISGAKNPMVKGFVIEGKYAESSLIKEDVVKSYEENNEYAEGGEVTRNTLIKNLKKGLVVTFKEDIGRLKYSYTMFYDKKNNDIILKEETERKFARNVADKNIREENNIISQKYAFELYQEITGDRKGIKDFNEFYDTNEYAGGGSLDISNREKVDMYSYLDEGDWSYESFMERYNKDMSEAEDIIESWAKSRGFDKKYAKGGKTYVMTDDTYVNIFLSRGFTEKRSAYGLRFFEHKPTGIFITYDQRGIQTPVIISTNKSGEESIYEGNTIREVKQALDNAGVSIIKEGIDPTYAGGGKVGMIHYEIGGLVSEDIPFEYKGKKTSINYEVGFHEGGIDTETFKETPSGYYVRIMPYATPNIRRFVYPEKDIEIAYLSEFRAITMLLFEADKDTKANQKIAKKEGKKNLPKLLKYISESREEEDEFDENSRKVQDAIWGSDEDEEEYAGGGEVDILKLYQKDTFSDKDSDLINDAIENGDIYTDEIKDDFLGYIQDQKHDFTDEQIWSYTDENYSNGQTHKENYKNLVEYIKENEYAFGGEVEDWMEQALESLIQETGFDELEITMVSDNGNEFIATDNKLEYRVFKTEDDAEEKAIEGIREDMEESPENFNKDFIIQYIDGREYFENELNEMNGAYAYEIQNESDEKYENRLIAEMVEWGILNEEQAESDNAEELAEQNIDEFIFLLTNDQLEQGNSGLDYFISTFGEEETMKIVINNNLIDIDEASKDAVQTDGIAHFLSSYDGETLYLKNDFVAYRVN
jgi:hypothetical protein